MPDAPVRVGENSARLCPGTCAYPFAVPDYIPAMNALNGDVGVDGMISVIGHEVVELATNLLVNVWEMDLQRTSDSESKEVEDIMPSLSSRALFCQPGSCHKKPIENEALQFGHGKVNTGRAEMCYREFGNWLSHRRKEPKFEPAENHLHILMPISGNNTSRSQAQEGSHNSIVLYCNPAEDGSTRIPSGLGNNQLLTLEEQHSESEATIQEHIIVDMASISSGENFHPGTFGESNSYPPAQSQALGSHQDDRRKEPKFVLAENLLSMQTPISGNDTSRSQGQEGSHNSIVPYFNPAEDGSTRILSWLGNNQLTPEEQHSESETTIQDHCIVDMPSISSGANFQAGTFGESNSYPPAQVVINYLAVPSDIGTQNPTADQYWLKISKILIPVSAGAVYNSSSMFAKVANTLAFIATLTAISLRPTRSRAIRISTKFGAIACAAGTLVAIGHDLPDDYRWASGVAFLIPAVAVAVA
ncbi:hypothetical protein RHSIM_Rhsim09G0118700 [Rhododendron simsii]|uniref:Uncharacterized protein n=1 Tax=Rhododendron simsii TaxID=118357 RepID=A0A834GEB5_RHOSS|nr:hypothetical protein RHSIM_Rhsim09G0118700 [Rhododendron simsii]